MAMKTYNHNVTVPVFGLVREDWQSVGTLYTSPRVNGQLRIRKNPLPGHTRVTASYDRVETFNQFGTSIRKFSTNDFLHQICLNRGLNPHVGFDPLVREDAIIEAYAKLSEKVANVADVIRTRRETQNMVINALIDIRKAYSNIRRGRIKRASSILGVSLHERPRSASAAGRWLEYSYGWSPLVQDVYNILDKGFGELKLDIRARSFRSKSTSISFTNATPGPYHTGAAVLTTVHRASCSIRVSFPGTAFPAISAWGLDNPALLAWEALPYSFVVDWFLPIGNYLETSCNVLANCKLEEMSITQRVDTDLSAYARMTESVKFPVYSNGALSKSVMNKTRSVGVVARPLPRFESPFTSLDRFWNQLALAKAEFGRRTL